MSGEKGELCKKEQRLIDSEKQDGGMELERLSDVFNFNININFGKTNFSFTVK